MPRQGRAPFMMRWIVGSSLQYRFLVVGIAAAMMVFGITRLGHMPVDVFPEFAPPTAEIQTEALGLSAAEVENLVTLNTEELLAGVPWLKTMRSRSVPGMSSVQLIFQPGTNLMQARQLVQERLILSYLLPNVSQRPVMLNPVSATSRTMMIGVSSKKLSPLELSVLARWTIKPRLMGVPGVANVSVWGHRERQLQVQIDPERLRAHGITQEQIIKTTGDSLWVSPLTFLNASFPGTGGWIDTPNQRLGVQHVLPISTPEDLARVPVDGAKVRLGDVATVVEGHPLLIGDAFHNAGAGLMMVIEKFPGTNTLEVTRGIDAALDALRPGLPGVDVDSRIFRAATFIEMAFDNLTTALVLGGLLVVVVLGAFLASWRTAVISLIAIPLSLLTAALVLYVRGATLNTMVLAGFVIAVGAIVDDAIVAVDQVVRELRRLRPGERRATGPHGAARLRRVSCADHPCSACGAGQCPRPGGGRHCGLASARPVVPALVQGAAPADRLGRAGGDLSSCDDPRDEPGGARAAGRARSQQRQRSPRTRDHWRSGGRHQRQSALADHRSQGQLRGDSRRRRAGGRRLSRTVGERANVPPRPDAGSVDRRRRCHRRPALRPGAGHASADGAGCEAGPLDNQRHRRSEGRGPGRGSPDRSQGRSGRGRTTWPQARRYPPAGRHRLCRPPGRHPVRAAEGVRGRGVGRARGPHEPHEPSRAASGDAQGQARTPEGSGGAAHRPDSHGDPP